jgi:hypothetical protein
VNSSQVKVYVVSVPNWKNGSLSSTKFISNILLLNGKNIKSPSLGAVIVEVLDAISSSNLFLET